MVFNWLVVPTLALSYGLFALGYWLSSRYQKQWQICAVVTLGALLAAPGILIALYYLHLYDNWCGFYQFRSVWGTELSAGGVGFIGGMIAYWSGKRRMLKLVSTTGLLVIMTFGVALPHLKPLIASAEFGKFHNRWEGVVCRQSTGYSCGAASTATILRYFDKDASELEIAEECFTYNGGTENWYIARALRSRGLQVTFHTAIPENGIPFPSIAGVRLGGVGHFITILEEKEDFILVGDPLVGERRYRKDLLEGSFDFTGFFMVVRK